MSIYREIFVSRKMLLMLLMGFSSGLPLALTGGTLQAWMKEANVDLKVIGIFSLVGLPYTLKFVWAPVMDLIVPKFLGRRRGWMLITQLALMVSIVALGSSNPAAQPFIIAALALVLAFFSASQDIVIDAYRTEILVPEERGAGAAISNLGYRLAMITSGAAALILADHLPWHQVYWIMAGAMIVGIMASLIAAEPTVSAPPRSLREAVIQPFVGYFKRAGSIEILAFVILYKIDIVLAVALTTPFMLDLGFTKTDIGAVTKGVGMIAAILGSLAGGAMFAQLGMRSSLLIFGIIQGLSTFSFALLSEVGNNMALMATTVGFENFCAGLATAPFTAFLMALCDKRFTATHFALLTSFSALSRVFAGAITGYLVEAMGWTTFFVFCAITAIPGLLMIMFLYDSWGVEDDNRVTS